MIAEEEKIPFTSHLEELRGRLIKCFIAVGVGFAASYGFKEILFNILVRPLVKVMEHGDHLIFTGLPEAFFTYLKVSLLAGLMLARSFSLPAPFSGILLCFPGALSFSWGSPPNPSGPCPP
jgi:Sec-independent protein secretion pathway component TatC